MNCEQSKLTVHRAFQGTDWEKMAVLSRAATEKHRRCWVTPGLPQSHQNSLASCSDGHMGIRGKGEWVRFTHSGTVTVVPEPDTDTSLGIALTLWDFFSFLFPPESTGIDVLQDNHCISYPVLGPKPLSTAAFLLSHSLWTRSNRFSILDGI